MDRMLSKRRKPPSDKRSAAARTNPNKKPSEKGAASPVDGIRTALPSWPSEIHQNATWLDLFPWKSLYSHHPSIPGIERTAGYHYCVPRAEYERLLSIFDQSRGGSVLVTGYRGTGKTSFVNHVVSCLVETEAGGYWKKLRSVWAQIRRSPDPTRTRYFEIRINLSTSRTAKSLVMMMFQKLESMARAGKFNEAKEEILDAVRRFHYRRTSAESTTKTRITELSTSFSLSWLSIALAVLIYLSAGEVEDFSRWWCLLAAPGIMPVLTSLGRHFFRRESMKRNENRESASETLVENEFPLHEAQQELHSILSRLSRAHKKVIFIFDEVDKLNPDGVSEPESSNSERLRSIQQLVSDLKFLLTESEAFHIFIAGKDVDDSWQEDQNKGEGLFESIFVQNIYLPSTLSANLEPAVGPHRWLIHTYRSLGGSGSDLLKCLQNALTDRSLDEIGPLEDKEPEWIRKVLDTVMAEIGLDRRSWTYNTGLLVIPLLSPLEIWKILLRYRWRCSKMQNDQNNNGNHRAVGGGLCRENSLFDDEIIRWIDAVEEMFEKPRPSRISRLINCLNKRLKRNRSPETETASSSPKTGLRNSMENGGRNSQAKPQTKAFIKRLFESSDIQLKNVDPMTERRIRRIRYLVEYLTYKGRGIPRKILREFYGLIQHTEIVTLKDSDYWKKRGNIRLVIYSPTTVRQKIKFFASIVSQIDANRDRFRFLNDKGRVATFHIIDHILKHFQTGFTWTDLENATFMTRREELFPSRELLQSILAVFEDHLFEAHDRRHHSYRLLPRIKHDLADLYQAFGPEQIELRFTRADFEKEIADLRERLAKVESVEPSRRHESVKAQIRLAKIFELLGKHEIARQEYSKALRWIRADLRRICAGNPKSRFPALTTTTMMTFLMSANAVLSRLGYLYDLDRDFRTALHYYETIIRFLEGAVMGEVRTNQGEEFTSFIGRTLEIDPDSGTRGASPAIPGNDGSSDATSKIASLSELVGKMAPEDSTVVFPFGSMSPLTDDLPSVPRALHTGFESGGIAVALNLVAVTLEKLWHRYASNRFLINALDYYHRCGDEYNTIDQMIFIGEIMMRRRDVRLAAGWYLAALRRANGLQLVQADDLTSRQPAVQASAKAKLYEYLGDVWYATRGTAFVDDDEMESLSRSQSCIVPNVMKRIRKGEVYSVDDEHFDDRDEEYFYTQALYLFGRNRQPLRQCDVALKKLEIRRNRLTMLIRRYYQYRKRHPCRRSGPQPPRNMLIRRYQNWKRHDEESLWKTKLAWGDFWIGAERAFNSLIDINPGNRRIKPMEMGRIIDRRRYGELLSSIGRMLLVAAEGDVYRWCWGLEIQGRELAEEPYKKCITKSLERTMRLHPKRQIESEVFKNMLRERVDTKRIGAVISRMIGSLVDEQAVFHSHNPAETKICQEEGIGIRSPLWNLGKRAWREEHPDRPNQFLLGQLYFFLGFENEDGTHSDSNDAFRIRTLYRSEIVLLSAYLALDDNIRGVESAAASRNLGVLYLVSIVRFVFSPHNLIWRDKMVAIRYFRLKRGKQFLSLYNAFHIASKRYLVNAIDILRRETERNRANSYELLRAQQALGDLLVIRSEILGCIERMCKEGNTTGPRMHCYLESFRSEDCKDLDLKDCRIQAVEAYRDCCRTILSDIEDYIKRYRFPEDAMFQHGDVMNRRLHWDIAQSIRSRHFDYRFNGDSQGNISVSCLYRRAQELSVRLYAAHPDCDDRQTWLEGLYKLFDLLEKTAVRKNWIEVKVGKTENRHSEKQYSVVARTPQTDSAGAFRFFRSFDDKLGRKPGPTGNEKSGESSPEER